MRKGNTDDFMTISLSNRACYIMLVDLFYIFNRFLFQNILWPKHLFSAFVKANNSLRTSIWYSYI